MVRSDADTIEDMVEKHTGAISVGDDYDPKMY